MFKKIKTQIRLKFAKWKIERFLSINEVEFVIAHYQEEIDYLDFFPKNSKITIYHKGEKPINKIIYQQYKNVKIFDIPNIGRNGHTIFYHIVKNYNELSPITVFLPGSFNAINPYKTKKRFAKIVNKIVNFIPMDYKGVYTSGSYRWWYHLNYFKNLRIKRLIKEDFTLDYYQSTNQQNLKFNPSSKLEPAKIRPMGNWYKHYFGDRKYAPVDSMHELFGVKKSSIKQHSIEKYKELISQFSEAKVAYELEHYVERLWPSIFMK